MNKTGKIAGYIRVSTERQIEGTSLDDQKETIKAYCRYQGYDPDSIVWFEDGGISGYKNDRKAYSEMKERIQQGEFDMVIVKKTDRISRKLSDLLDLIEEVIHPSGASYVDCSFNFDTKAPMGKMMLQMLGMFAEFDRNQIKRRMEEGRVRRAVEGKFATGEIPYGYKKTEDGIQIDPEQAKVISLIGDLYEEHSNYSAVARELNKRDIPTKNGGKWYPQSVKNILTNDKYQGKISQVVGGRVIEALNEELAIRFN